MSRKPLKKDDRVRVLFVGEKPKRSAPSRTLAGALSRRGVETKFAGGIEEKDSRRWLEMTNKSTVIIVVKYLSGGAFFRRQLAMTVALGTPAIRWWVGSDVLYVLEQARARQSAQALNPLFARQVAVAPHLVEELATANITATFVPSVLDSENVDPTTQNPRDSFLVYLPGHKLEFYGEPLIREAITQFPDTRFIIVGDDTHCLSSFPNVTSLGWISNMEPIWDQVGGLIRITHHDGMPRMVMDALRRGKHVIYAWPYPGCRLAKSRVELMDAIADFKVNTQVNVEGMKAIQEFTDPSPADRMIEIIREVAFERALIRRCRAALIATHDTIGIKRRPFNPSDPLKDS